MSHSKVQKQIHVSELFITDSGFPNSLTMQSKISVKSALELFQIHV